MRNWTPCVRTDPTPPSASDGNRLSRNGTSRPRLCSGSIRASSSGSSRPTLAPSRPGPTSGQAMPSGPPPASRSSSSTGSVSAARSSVPRRRPSSPRYPSRAASSGSDPRTGPRASTGPSRLGQGNGLAMADAVILTSLLDAGATTVYTSDPDFEALRWSHRCRGALTASDLQQSRLSHRPMTPPVPGPFELPPDVSFRKELLGGAQAYVFRHARLGDLGRVVLRGRPEGRTDLSLELAGDPRDPARPRSARPSSNPSAWRSPRPSRRPSTAAPPDPQRTGHHSRPRLRRESRASTSSASGAGPPSPCSSSPTTPPTPAASKTPPGSCTPTSRAWTFRRGSLARLS